MTTLEDPLQLIARRTRVSPNTVLRVLRGENKEVWPSAVRRADEIRSLANELGYRPLASARTLRRGRCDAVGLLLSAERGRSHLPEDLFNAVADACDAAKQRLVVAKVSDDRLTDSAQVPRLLAEWSCDGMLVNYTDHIPTALPDLFTRCRIPAVWINSRHDADAVWYDDHGGGATAAGHLLALGHRRICWLDFVGPGPEQHYSRSDRPAGITATLAAAGLAPVDGNLPRQIPVDERLAATIALLKRKDRPTALIAYDGAERLLYAAALVGLRVPQDLSLIVFGSEHEADATTRQSHLGRQPTLLATPETAAGRRAVELLLAKLASSEPQPSQVLPLTLKMGDTCGPVPGRR
jgi:LacI family transcriptional regulator